MEANAYRDVIEMMPKHIAEKLAAVDGGVTKNAVEIRLRADKPCAVYSGSTPYFINLRGSAVTELESGCVSFSQSEIKSVVAHMCEYSLYKKEDELRQGFVAIKGGHRIGVCATCLQSGVIDVSAISSVSIRIAREHRGCAAGVFGATMTDGMCSLLIAGPPLSGKTTIVRDLSRMLSSKPLYKKAVVIDERGELASVCDGVPVLDTGTCTDVLDGYRRKHGFDIAIRTLSPDVIVCDELGDESDFECIENAGKSGVKVLATVHAGSIGELVKRKQVSRCIDSGIFEYVVFLDTFPNIGRVTNVHRVVS